DLEAARPVDPDPGRVGVDPLTDVLREGARISRLAGHAIRLSELNHPLVAVQLPDHLAVADRLRVERIDEAPVSVGGATVRDRGQTTGDRIAGRARRVAQEIEAAATYRLRDRHRLLARGRHSAADEARGDVTHGPVEEAARGEGAEAFKAHARVGPEAGARDQTGPLE